MTSATSSESAGQQTAMGRGPVASGARPADARPGRHLRGDLLQPCRSATRGPGLAWNTMFWGFCFALVLRVGSRPYLWRGQTTPGSSEDLDAPWHVRHLAGGEIVV